MCEKKLEKYLVKFENKYEEPQTPAVLKPVVLGDSKGRWLRSFVKTTIESEILWLCSGGCTSERGYGMIEKNIEHYIQIFGKIHLYVWLGTCDLSTLHKQSKLLTIKNTQEDALREIINCYHKFVALIKKYPGNRITILETPVYSIDQWNLKKAPSVRQEEQLDIELIRQIIELNGSIRYINDTLGSSSPAFSADISHHLSARSRLRRGNITDNYNFNLYVDGIHPVGSLARVWLKKLSAQVRFDCWE